MSNLNVNKVQTPFQTLKNTTPAQFVKDNAGLSAAAAGASSVIAYNVAQHSEIAASAIKKGAIPLVGAGTVLLGASMVHDAFVQGKEASKSKDAAPAIAAEVGKGALGAGLILAGAEVAARPFGGSPLKLLGKAISHPVGTAALMASPGIGAAVWGAQDIQKNGLNLGNTVALGAGASWTALQAPLASMELLGVEHKATDIAFKGAAVVGGASLGLGSVVLGKKAYESMQEGKWGATALYAGGATAAGVASLHVLGNATGISALSNLAGKAFKNPLLAGSIAVVGLTGVAYVAYSNQKKGDVKAEPEAKPETQPEAKAEGK